MNLKSLAKDTAIYGLSSIVGRFLNYLLVPLYTTKILAESGGYGIVTNLYAYTALLLALLTFGMETTLFRFSTREGEDRGLVYSTALRIVGTLAFVFLFVVVLALKPLSLAMGYAEHPEYILAMAFVVAMDAFQAIMFSHLRLEGKALKFMGLKFAFIIPNILLNLAIFFIMPRFAYTAEIYHRFSDGVGLIFFANLLCTFGVFFLFGDERKAIGGGFDRALARRMLSYSWPLLLLSLVGILNQVADKILFPFLGGPDAQVQLGIYGACVKIAMIMSLLTQAFRYAYEPIVFNGSASKDSPETLAEGMKWFVIVTLFAFLAVIVYLPVLKYFIGSSYWEGLKVVPIVMAAEIFMGVYFNLSFWYKLTDKTWWGAVLSGIGAAVMIAVNVVFVPKIGYMACAWGGFAGYGVAMVLSWAIGRGKYPVPYDAGRISAFVIVALSFLVLYNLLQRACLPLWGELSIGTALLGVYAILILKELKSYKK